MTPAPDRPTLRGLDVTGESMLKIPKNAPPGLGGYLAMVGATFAAVGVILAVITLVR